LRKQPLGIVLSVYTNAKGDPPALPGRQ